MNATLPTLTFKHRFSTGLEVTLTVFRRENEVPRMESDRRDFHDNIEDEYRRWVWQVSDMLVDERLITEGEILALAVRNILAL